MANSRLVYIKSQAFSEGTLDFLFETPFFSIEERAETSANKLSIDVYRKAYVCAYKEGRAAFDTAGHARVTNPYERARRLS